MFGKMLFEDAHERQMEGDTPNGLASLSFTGVFIPGRFTDVTTMAAVSVDLSGTRAVALAGGNRSSNCSRRWPAGSPWLSADRAPDYWLQRDRTRPKQSGLFLSGFGQKRGGRGHLMEMTSPAHCLLPRWCQQFNELHRALLTPVN